MARHLNPDINTTYRVVISQTYPLDHRYWPGQTFTDIHGPYSRRGTAQSVATQRVNAYARRDRDIEIAFEVQQSCLKWEPVA